VDRPSFNALHLSAAFTRLAFFTKRRKLNAADVRSPLWTRLSARLHLLLKHGKIPPRAAANILWSIVPVSQAFGKQLPWTTPSLIRYVKDKAGSMNAFDLANSLWAVARLQEVEPQVLTAALANILWSVANLHEKAPEALAVVSVVAARIPRRVSEFNPQDLSNCLWAAASLQEASPGVLAAVPAMAQCVPGKVENMLPQHLSNCMWAAANLQESTPDVLTFVPWVADRIRTEVHSMIPQALSNCLWAAAYLQHAAPAVLRAVPAIASAIPGKADGMSLQELSNCFWASGNLQEAAPVALAAIPALSERLPRKLLDSMASKQRSGGLHANEKLHRRATRLPWQFAHRARWRT
ncbi:unnamed protein product, partial [Symbiodinium necroappetens]